MKQENIMIIIGILLVLSSTVWFFVPKETITYDCIDDKGGRFIDELCEKEVSDIPTWIRYTVTPIHLTIAIVGFFGALIGLLRKLEL